MKVKSENEVAQLYQAGSDHMDCSLPGSSVHGIFQARVLEWGANASPDLELSKSLVPNQQDERTCENFLRLERKSAITHPQTFFFAEDSAH